MITVQNLKRMEVKCFKYASTARRPRGEVNLGENTILHSSGSLKILNSRGTDKHFLQNPLGWIVFNPDIWPQTALANTYASHQIPDHMRSMA